MKVIKNNLEEENKKSVPETITIKCEHCGSILEISQNDLYEGSMLIEDERSRPEYCHFLHLVTCPCCGKPTRPAMVKRTADGWKFDFDTKFPYSY